MYRKTSKPSRYSYPRAQVFDTTTSHAHDIEVVNDPRQHRLRGHLPITSQLSFLLLILVAFTVSLFIPVTTFAQGREGDLYAFVRSFLQDDGWNPQPVPGANAIETGFQGDNGTLFCRVFMLEEKRQIVFYSVLPNKTPLERRIKTMEFITRANFGLGIGNFELDVNDGEIRFKTSVDIEGGQITPTMLETLIYINVLTMDRYLPGLNAVMFGGMDPLDALQEVQDELEAGSSGG